MVCLHVNWFLTLHWKEYTIIIIIHQHYYYYVWDMIVHFRTYLWNFNWIYFHLNNAGYCYCFKHKHIFHMHISFRMTDSHLRLLQVWIICCPGLWRQRRSALIEMGMRDQDQILFLVMSHESVTVLHNHWQWENDGTGDHLKSEMMLQREPGINSMAPGIIFHSQMSNSIQFNPPCMTFITNAFVLAIIYSFSSWLKIMVILYMKLWKIESIQRARDKETRQGSGTGKKMKQKEKNVIRVPIRINIVNDFHQFHNIFLFTSCTYVHSLQMAWHQLRRKK